MNSACPHIVGRGGQGYGSKTSSGWGTPLNLKGTDGNANVIRCFFQNRIFSLMHLYDYYLVISDDVRHSSWNVYLVETQIAPFSFDMDMHYNHVPGITRDGDLYSVNHNLIESMFSQMAIEIQLEDSTETFYDQIEVICIEANETVDNRKLNGAIVPDHLDVSDYEAVAEYYSFYSE